MIASSISLLMLQGRTRTWAQYCTATVSGSGVIWILLRRCLVRSTIVATTKSWGASFSAPGVCFVPRFPSRLELLGVSMGFCSFERWIRGRKIIVHCDNKGAEVWPLGLLLVLGEFRRFSFPVQESIRRGTARPFDHAQLVHAQWLQAAVLGMGIFVKRVNTEDNIADLPSRRVRCSVHPCPCYLMRN